MNRYIAALIIIISFVQCTKQETEYSRILSRAAEMIEQHPDSSLSILNSLKLTSLTNKEERASYALLKSMALDKNYIDVTNDSLTSIALAYYQKHGTPDEKLKAYYYNGTVCLNDANYEGAMDNYIHAEEYVDDCEDYVSVGRLYNAKMMVHKEIFNVEKAIEPAELAARYYLKGKDTVRFMTALNNLSSMLLAADKFDSLKVCFDKIKQYENYFSVKQKNNYYANLINYKIAVSDSTLRMSIEDYMKCFNNKISTSHLLILARAYLKTGEKELALKALNDYKQISHKPSDLYYYYISEVYNSSNDFKNAYSNLKVYQELTNRKDYKIHRSDTKFLEERYASQIKHIKDKYLIILLGLSIIIILFIMGLLYKYLKNMNLRRIQRIEEIEEQKHQLINEYEKALAEQEKLRNIIANKSLDPNIKEVIEQRLAILNGFIVSNISGVNMEQSIRVLKKFMENNGVFLQSTRMSFEITHPKFISYLAGKGLSNWEIQCCCLYCIGLNGSEISNYLNEKYFYKKSSIIRKKLEIKSVNIDTFLMNKMKELYQ